MRILRDGRFFTVFRSMVGLFDMDDYTNLESQIMIMIFIVVMVLILLNVLIAIMADTYERVMEGHVVCVPTLQRYAPQCMPAGLVLSVDRCVWVGRIPQATRVHDM